ncbi:MAG: hypothetical protein RSB42_06905 [Comamonas sp.]
MNTPPDKTQAKRDASFRSSFFTSRGMTIIGAVLVFLLIAIFVPW